MNIPFCLQSELKFCNKNTFDINDVFVIGRVQPESVRKILPLNGQARRQAMFLVKRLSGFEDRLPIIFSEEIYKANLRPNLDKELVLFGSYRTEIHEQHAEDEGCLFQYIALEHIDPNPGNYDQTHNNSVHVRGTICKPPLPRALPASNIYYFCMAVDTPEHEDYIPCVCKNEYSEYIREMIPGDRIEVLGRMASRVYQDESGQNIETREFRVNKIENIEYK